MFKNRLLRDHGGTGDGGGGGGSTDEPASVPREEYEKLMERVEKLEASRDRVLNESREHKQRATRFKEEVENKDRERLEAEGKLQELLDLERNKLTEREREIEALKRRTLKKSLDFEVARLANDAYDVRDITASLPSELISINEDTGEVSGVDDAIGRLRKEKPYLFKQGEKPGMVTSKPRGEGQAGDGGNKTVKEMSAEERKHTLAQALAASGMVDQS